MDDRMEELVILARLGVLRLGEIGNTVSLELVLDELLCQLSRFGDREVAPLLRVKLEEEGE